MGPGYSPIVAGVTPRAAPSAVTAAPEGMELMYSIGETGSVPAGWTIVR